MSVDNLSRWSHAAFPSYDRDGRDVLVVVVGATFDIPLPSTTAPRPSATQPAVPLEDRYFAHAGSSGLTQVAQTAYVRPGADVYVRGSIRCEHPLTARELRLEVGELCLESWVVGDRRWERSLSGWHATEPEPFEAMPIAWERCYGGPREGRNLVGCHPPRGELAGRPLPNFEAHGALIQTPKDRRDPVGFGPVPPQWQPRLGHAGTYDESWQRDRAPYWPENLDLRFFHAAPPRLRRGCLRGGEAIVLGGFLPGPARCFELPRVRMQLKYRAREGIRRRLMRVDGLEIDLDRETVTLYARHSIDLEDGLGKFEIATLRELQDWEADP
ncbi:hypothetical protein ENSA5_38130 [Enhygromyxa salina]|uniref:DUF2169 domain-containing protein n=1 Tax=Enhygromyxa salina TaxID=215803 RepID=A0A2S9XS08_9BACT|nr:DUF2169 domain-containing protein [Enhygromyxa salina]PRP95530.1 hypothetical protein ENSA5_38130 [Enhygromyxa salina]